MEYFVAEPQRKASRSSCYFEFQRGRYQDKCWLADSLSLHDGIWDKYKMSELFKQIIPEFDYYGLTEVTRAQWAEIRALPAEDVQRKILCELAPWAESCFETEEVFTIIGM